MGFKNYAKADLAALSGVPATAYTSFADLSAIPQALLLFKIGTCLASPDALSAEEKQLVDFAIISMAESIYRSQPFAAVAASPFNSESIGSYSYSKTSKAVQTGAPTGIMWFDMAVDKLSVCDLQEPDIMFGGVENFEHDGTIVDGSSGQNLRFLSPAETDQHGRYLRGIYAATSTSVVMPGTGNPDDGEDWVEDPDNPGFLIPSGGS